MISQVKRLSVCTLLALGIASCDQGSPTTKNAETATNEQAQKVGETQNTVINIPAVDRKADHNVADSQKDAKSIAEQKQAAKEHLDKIISNLESQIPESERTEEDREMLRDVRQKVEDSLKEMDEQHKVQ